MRRLVSWRIGCIFFITFVLIIGKMCFAQTHTMYENTQYDLRVQRTAQTQRVYSANVRVLDVKFLAVFYVEKEDVPFIHNKLGPDYAKKVVPETVQSEISRLTSRLTDSEIISKKRDELQQEVLDNVGKKLSPYRIRLRDVMFVSIKYSPEMEAAVIKKAVAEEQLALAKIESQAIAVRWQAQKDAAKFEAEKNKIISDGLDSKILQLKYIQALEALSRTTNRIVVVYGDGDIRLPSFESDTQAATATKKKKSSKPMKQQKTKKKKPLKPLKSPYENKK